MFSWIGGKYHKNYIFYFYYNLLYFFLHVWKYAEKMTILIHSYNELYHFFTVYSPSNFLIPYASCLTSLAD